jgi:bacteriophage HK97-gp10 putative tail-component
MPDIHVKGLSELQQFLDTLAPKIERNVLRGALRAGAVKELLPETQANLLAAGAVKTGALIAGLKVKTRARGGRVEATVTATGPHAFIAKWIEFGVKAHNIPAKAGGWLFFNGIFARSVWHPGFKARGFMRRALDHSGGAAVIAAAEYMKQRLVTKAGLDTSDVTIALDE